MDILDVLEFADFPSYLSGFSALERYFSMEWGEVLQVETEGSIVDLSKLFEDISFPGPSRFDAVLEHSRGLVLFRCIDDEGGLFGGDTIGGGATINGNSIGGVAIGEARGEPRKFRRTLPPPSPRIARITQALNHQGSLLYDIQRRAFVDRQSAYYQLRDKTLAAAREYTDYVQDSSRTGNSAGTGNFRGSGNSAGTGNTAAAEDSAVSKGAGGYRAGGDIDGSRPVGFDLPSDTKEQSLWHRVFEAALIIARIGYEPSPALKAELCPSGPTDFTGPAGSNQGVSSDRATGASPAGKAGRIPIVEQRFLLTGVLTGKWAGRGLRLLEESGFIDAHWPLLSAMGRVDHSKEHHPEGNVWRHTVEAFAYRKIRELPLSLALLLHDSGKPFTGPHNGNAFDGHAQIGANKALQFLTNLGFGREIVEQVDYFIRNHMLPTYIPKLPFSRTEDVLSSPHFPELLELYRCDVSSTYRGPDGYYRACTTYRNFLKNRKNPFRSSDGKKRLRMLVD